jgi:hypothetical protein
VDPDGNERAGIRTPEQAVPVATYTGWNFRSPSTGAPMQFVSLAGSSIPFAAKAAERRPNDPRISVDERYGTKEQFLARARDQFTKLVNDRYLLAQDEAAIMKRSADQWDLVHGAPAGRSTGNP